jgi:hypothetical protein
MRSEKIRRPTAAFAVALLAGGALFAVVTTTSRAETRSPGTNCGGTLWRLMNLSDADRGTVNLHGVRTTIANISALHTPIHIRAARTTPFQQQVWRMRTVVDRYRIASNGEIVFSLYSIDSAQYMNAYLPNPHCLGERSRDRTGMIAARRELTTHCPRVTAQWQLIGVTVDLGGVGFWNSNTTTRGAARNGAELRPLTNFKIVSGCGVGG